MVRSECMLLIEGGFTRGFAFGGGSGSLSVPDMATSSVSVGGGNSMMGRSSLRRFLLNARFRLSLRAESHFWLDAAEEGTFDTDEDGDVQREDEWLVDWEGADEAILCDCTL